MLKVGMKDICKQQLIEVMMQLIVELGMQNIIIVSISKCVGMFFGIISYYFGGKQGLIEVVLCYLLDQLGKELCECMVKIDWFLLQWLNCIIEFNFFGFQCLELVVYIWFSFWVWLVYELGFKWFQ